MRFLDELGKLHKQPPKTKAAKLWMVGLEWQSVDKGTWGAAAREQAGFKTVRGAVAIQAQKHSEDAMGKPVAGAMHVGLWALTFGEEEELQLKLPRACYSLAAVFALAAQSQNKERSALYLDLGAVDGVNHAYFCRLYGGVPVTDAVFTREKAAELALQAQGEGDAVFSNDQDLLTESTPINFAWFSGATDKRALVKPVPVNWVWIAAVAAVLLTAVAGGTVYKLQQEKARIAELARIDAENDPVPRYQAALATQRLRLGMDRAGAGKLYADIMRTPKAITGWELTQIECSLDACGATWKRTQGTFADAKNERPHDKLLIPTIDDQGRVTATALATIKTALSIKPALSDLPVELPSYDAYVLSTGNMFQKWANAGVSVQSIGAAATWPAVAGAQDLRLPGVVGKGEFFINGINAVFGAEVLGQLPASVRIRKLVVHSSDTLTLDLSGDFYVAK